MARYTYQCDTCFQHFPSDYGPNEWAAKLHSYPRCPSCKGLLKVVDSEHIRRQQRYGPAFRDYPANGPYA